MTRHISRHIVLLVTTAAAAWLWAEPPVSSTATPSVALTLSAFSSPSGGTPGPGWTEADGVIHLQGKGGNIVSKEDYENFTLEWEWKVAAKGNNGIKYWVAPVGKEWLGIEYQMIDDTGHPDAKNGPKRTTAAIYDISPVDANKPTKPVGEWNQSKVVVSGGKIEHWLNGQQVARADTKSPEWATLIAASKFKGKAGFAPGKGRIMLTDHSDETWFRHIRIQKL